MKDWEAAIAGQAGAHKIRSRKRQRLPQNFRPISDQALRGGSAKLLKFWWTWSGSNRRPPRQAGTHRAPHFFRQEILVDLVGIEPTTSRQAGTHRAPHFFRQEILVDLVGIEPTTSSMPWKRAPSCATGPRWIKGRNYKLNSRRVTSR